MRALVLNCTLKTSPEPSSTEALASVVSEELERLGFECELIRVIDHNVLPGVATNEGKGDDWPMIHDKVLAAEVLILASPTWLGQASSVAQRVIERMDAMLSETDDEKRPVAYNHVAGVVATGNEDGAKHVIAELSSALIELGFTVPGQSWTYFNNGAPMGPTYLETEDKASKERPHRNARLAAHNLAAVASALQATPITSPSR
jgi:multimeric flavodoxin WrbA